MTKDEVLIRSALEKAQECNESNGYHNSWDIDLIVNAVLKEAQQEALPPIERDEEMDRTYIPIAGGWEIQTKGKGSSFRICNVKTHERMLVADEYLQGWLTRMALDNRAATHPTLAREWVGLTDEEIEKAIGIANEGIGSTYYIVIRAISQALKEKNHG
jgi:hypothetical protein